MRINAKSVIWISFPVVFSACLFISEEELAYRQGGTSGCSNAWYLDSDGDGVGGSVSLMACDSPGDEYTTITGDCDDSNVSVSPNAVEDCETDRDEDCDGTCHGGRCTITITTVKVAGSTSKNNWATLYT